MKDSEKDKKATEWEKTFAKHVSDKQLLPKMLTKILLQLNNKKANKLTKNGPKTLPDTTVGDVHQ